MKIVHVILGLPKAAGTTTFLENVVREQRALGHEVTVLTYLDEQRLNSTAVLTCDVFHLHCLWSPFLHKAARVARKCHKPVVWSTHGMTAPWSLRHKWWKKCLPWYLYQRNDLREASLVHCTTDLEVGWNRRLGFSRTFVAPLGTTLSWTVEPQKLGELSRILLFVGRVYPVKALDCLIKAFALACKKSAKGADWVLRIVGPDQDGHMSELMTLCDELKLPYSFPDDEFQLKQSSGVQFAGPQYDADLDAEYTRCTALALVSHTENFGATVVDALAHAKPVITSTNTPWSVVKTAECGWWVSNECENLAVALIELFEAPASQLVDMGKNGYALVESEFTWSAVARTLIKAYNGVVK